MKKLISLLVMLASVSSFAESNKVCFGSTKNEDTKGTVMLAKINKKTITLKTIKYKYEYYNEYYEGTYPTYGTTTKGRDGKIYLNYKGEFTDYQDEILVDQELLKQGTTGLLQIRARGEGFFNNAFVCKDSQL
jgi:hypothetical protein